MHVFELKLFLIVFLELSREANIFLDLLPDGRLDRSALALAKSDRLVLVVWYAGDLRAPNPDIKQRTRAELRLIFE